jgi:hypothetical protein
VGLLVFQKPGVPTIRHTSRPYTFFINKLIIPVQGSSEHDYKRKGKGNCVSYTHASCCVFISYQCRIQSYFPNGTLKKLKITLRKIDLLAGICCSIVVTIGKIETTRNFMKARISQNQIDNDKTKVFCSHLSICYLPMQ